MNKKLKSICQSIFGMSSTSGRKNDPTEEYEASEPYRLPGIANLHAFVIYYCQSNMSWICYKIKS